jgi:hypothetical protein
MLQPKYNIGDKLTWTYTEDGELRLLPVVVQSISIYKDSVEYWPYEHCIEMKQKDLYTEDELMKLVKEFTNQSSKVTK